MAGIPYLFLVLLFLGLYIEILIYRRSNIQFYCISKNYIDQQITTAINYHKVTQIEGTT